MEKVEIKLPKLIDQQGDTPIVDYKFELESKSLLEEIVKVAFDDVESEITITIDTPRVTSEHRGTFEIQLIISDDGYLPRFDNIVYFDLSIQYIEIEEESEEATLEDSEEGTDVEEGGDVDSDTEVDESGSETSGAGTNDTDTSEEPADE